MTSNELLKLLQQAWSFPGLDPPSGSVELGSVEMAGDTYHLYKGPNEDGEETIFYETNRGYEFKRHMAELQKKRKKKRRCI